MNVQNVKINTINSNNQNKANTSFKATPKQILDALPKADLCPGKKGWLKSIAKYFKAMEIEIEEPFTYKLGQKNELSEDIAYLETKGLTLKELDKELNEDVFACSDKSDCECGKGYSAGEFAKKLLTDIGVENPDAITVNPREPKFGELVLSILRGLINM